MTTPADPAAIDVQRLQARWGWINITSPKGLVDLKNDGLALIAAVEALQERVAELEPIVKDGVRRAENCMEWQARAEAETARVVDSYAAGLEAAAIVADQHRGSAAKARLAKDQPLGRIDDDGLVVEIRAEERGEDIAAEIIAKAIRALGKEEE